MLLKITDGNGGWHIFEDVKYCHLLKSRSGIKTLEQLNEIIVKEDGLVVSLISKECLNSKDGINVGLINFSVNKKKYKALCVGLVYILNNKGDTIEKIDVSSLERGR